MKRFRILIVLALAVVGTALLVGACTSRGGDDEAASFAVQPPEAELSPVGGVEGVAVGTPAEVVEEPVAEGSAESGKTDLATAEPVDITPLTPLDAKVIQSAALTLSVPTGDFEEVVRSAERIADRFGGFVVSSSASPGEDQRLVRGTLVVSIPERSYSDAKSEIEKLGRVEARDQAGQDVTLQYVDLEARARHLEAVERQLLEFLEETTTIGDALVVQDRINQVQLQLEEIRGQLRYLDDQTSYATISLTIFERGVPVAGTDDGGWGIGDAWSTAADGFMKVIGGAFVALATAGPILAVLALLAIVGRIYWRRRRGLTRASDAAEIVPTPRPEA